MQRAVQVGLGGKMQSVSVPWHIVGFESCAVICRTEQRQERHIYKYCTKHTYKRDTTENQTTLAGKHCTVCVLKGH